MSTIGYHRVVWRLLVVVTTIVLAIPLGSIQAQTPTEQPPLQFCPIIGLPAAEFITLSYDEGSDSLSGEVAIVNPTTAYVPGTNIAIAVYQDGPDRDITIPVYWSILSGSEVLEPQSQQVHSFQVSASALMAGDYEVRVFVAQGENELLATALRGYERTKAAAFTKTGLGTSEAPAVAVKGARVFEGGSFVLSTSSVPVSVSLVGITTPQHLVVSRNQLPFGDSVYVDETVSSNAEYQWSLSDGSYHLYLTAEDRDSLQPLTAVQIGVGQTKDKWVTIYPYLSIIGLSAHPIVDGTTATVCLGNYSPDGHLVSVPTEAVQIDFQVLNAAGEVVDSKQPQTPRLQNFAEFSLNSIAPDSQFKVVLSTERVYNAATDGPDFEPVETIHFTHQCDADCQQLFTKSVTDFAEQRSVRESFWYFAGIVIAAALLMYLMLRRLNEPVPPVTYKSPDELQ